MIAAIVAVAVVGLVWAYRKWRKGELPGIPGGDTPSPDTLDFDLLLEEGVKGPEVKQLQQWIIRDGGGQFLGPSQDDGDFGPLTKAGLQEVKGLDRTTLNQYEASSGQISATSYSSAQSETTWG